MIDCAVYILIVQYIPLPQMLASMVTFASYIIHGWFELSQYYLEDWGLAFVL